MTRQRTASTAALLLLGVLAAPAQPAEFAVLLHDPLAENWRNNWTLDGEKATVEHRDGGLYFAAGTVTKLQDREQYHAHHAVLWTKKQFEGDLRITYNATRIDSSDYGTTLLYIQAQGTGGQPYENDIAKWAHLRRVPAMSLYFKHMSLISLSFRENLRCKRYPWFDARGERFETGGLIEPMVDYQPMRPGKSYRIKVEKRRASLHLKLIEKTTGHTLVDYTWDTSKNPPDQQPRFVEKGRIGLRHMSTRQFLYRDFKVERLD